MAQAQKQTQAKSFNNFNNNKFTNASLKTAEIIGIVTSITYPSHKGAPTFLKLYFPNSKRNYKCQCDFFCPLRMHDTIYGFCSIDDNDTLHLLRLPFVQPSIDKDNLIQLIYY